MRLISNPTRKSNILPPAYANMVRCLDYTNYHILGLPADADAPTFPDRQLAEVWLADRLPDLAPRLKRGSRPCLACLTTFMSEGIHNRLCDPCRGAA